MQVIMHGIMHAVNFVVHYEDHYACYCASLYDCAGYYYYHDLFVLLVAVKDLKYL